MAVDVKIIGAGLAGSEAAWQLAERGFQVKLYEMRPEKMTPAHQTDKPAELVCSNSLRSDRLTNAAGLLKEELRELNSLIIAAAEETSVPAGGALAVDREQFSEHVFSMLNSHQKIDFTVQEIAQIPEDTPVIIASGPLTSDRLAESIQKLTGEDYLHFYDAAAPIVEVEGINFAKAFKASRYEPDKDDYINCPMDREEFMEFWEFLLRAECNLPHDFEDEDYFEACLPIEVLARRGRKPLLYGPLKPVGLKDPRTGETPHAVVQLRQDNSRGTLYNMVGFQTRLKWGEQDRMLNFIPGLEAANIVRYGVMHRNTYLNSAKLLTDKYNLIENDNIFFAGQITGVEGYIESTSSGMVAAINCARQLQKQELLAFPETTAHGALAAYVSESTHDNLQPMNINYVLLPELEDDIGDKMERNRIKSHRAVKSLKNFMKKYNLYSNK